MMKCLKILTAAVLLFSISPVTLASEPEQKVTISTTHGVITVELFKDVAPKHAKSFRLHAEAGYFDGTTFHRVIPGFMIQGGDPNSKDEDRSKHGTGGHAAKFYGIGDKNNSSTWTIPAEFSKISHERGVLSMARAQDLNSAGSQFFIAHKDSPFLDSQYTVFGRVIEGMEVVDTIISQPRDTRDNPNKRIEMKVKLLDEKKK
jgi:cyclophilin family peptidyl-prolyl cis-trans isomerase